MALLKKEARGIAKRRESKRGNRGGDVGRVAGID
jgi:hypothetical protein